MPSGLRARISLAAAASALAVLLAAVLASLAFSASNECGSCHSGPSPDGSYTYAGPKALLQAPYSAQPRAQFNVTLEITHEGGFSMQDTQAVAAVSGGAWLSPGESGTKFMRVSLTSPAKFSFAWNLTAGALVSETNITVVVNYTARHSHINNPDVDMSRYSVLRQARVIVAPSAISFSSSELTVYTGGEKSASFNIAASSAASNISISVSPNLQPTGVAASPASIPLLSSGQSAQVQVIFKTPAEPVENGRLNVKWQDASGKWESAYIIVRIVNADTGSTAQGQLLSLRLAGRILGMSTIAFLGFSLGLGLFRLGNPARRARVHCAVSWVLLFMALYHGLILLYGPYASLIWGKYIIIGYAAAATMGAASVQGLMEDRMSRAMGAGAWRWSHRVLIISAAALGMAHGILMGTEFAAVRALWGAP